MGSKFGEIVWEIIVWSIIYAIILFFKLIRFIGWLNYGRD